MKTNMIIEMAPFQLAKGVSEKALFEASEILEHDFLRRQKGFIKRELLKSTESVWIDVVYWASESDARAATQKASESDKTYEFFQLLEFNEHYNPQDGAFHCLV